MKIRLALNFAIFLHCVENEYELAKDAADKERTAYLLWKSPQEVLFFHFALDLWESSLA